MTPASGAPQPAYRSQTKRLVGGALLVLGVLLCTSVFSRNLGLPNIGGFVEQTVVISNSYAGSRLALDARSGSVTLVRGADNTITIEQTKHGFGWSRAAARRDAEDFQPLISQSGDTITLSEPSQNNLTLFNRAARSDYRITLPSAAIVRASTASGSIDGRALDGQFNLSTSSGDVRLSDIAGTLTVEVGSGSISVRKSSLGQVQLESGSGDIQVDGVQAELHANSDSGSITVADLHDMSLNLDSGSGNIDVRNAAAAAFDLQASSGSIHFEGSLAGSGVHRARTSSGDLTVTLPQDAGFQLEAQTDSGTIDLPGGWNLPGQNEARAGQIGSGGPSLQLDTSSGDIDLARR
jgi:DUF4097 and DUF4098 domain-containing protein YvlB